MKRNFALTEQDEKLIEQQLATGRFADATDVVRAGLEMLADMRDDTDRWLDEDIARRVAEADDDPSILRPAEDVFAALEAHHARSGRAGTGRR